MNVRTAVASGLLLSTGLLPAPAAAQMNDACFDVVVGTWALGPIVGTADTTVAVAEEASPSWPSELPRRLQFVDSLNGRGRLAVRVPDGTLDTPHSWRFWSRTADSLEFTFTTGFTGTASRLSREGDRWRGRNRTFSDNLPYRSYERPITLEPADCDSPSPQPASLDPPLPRSVEFRNRPPVVLHESLPGAWVDTRGEAEWTADIETMGLLAGADSVRIRTARDGRVRQIHLVYPDAVDLSPIRRALNQAIASDGRRWANRTTVVMIRRFGFGPVVTLEDRRLDRR